MSLILEALRKSEAERRRGLPPDLLAELPPTPAQRTRAMPAWGWLVLGIGLLALVAWLALRPRPAIAPSGTTADRPPNAEAQSMPSQDQAPRIEPGTPTALPRITPQSARSVAQPMPAEPAPAAPQVPAPQENSPASPVASIEPPPPVPLPAPARVPTATPEPGRVLSLGELDAGAREALPPLRMSMHLWNENPTQRFAIIDGRRITEGDAIGDVRVVRIERDGVLLEWQGRGIRLPVR